MAGREDRLTHEFALVDGLSPADVAHVRREALRVLRPGAPIPERGSMSTSAMTRGRQG